MMTILARLPITIAGYVFHLLFDNIGIGTCNYYKVTGEQPVSSRSADKEAQHPTSVMLPTCWVQLPFNFWCFQLLRSSACLLNSPAGTCRLHCSPLQLGYSPRVIRNIVLLNSTDASIKVICRAPIVQACAKAAAEGAVNVQLPHWQTFPGGQLCTYAFRTLRGGPAIHHGLSVHPRYPRSSLQAYGRDKEATESGQ